LFRIHCESPKKQWKKFLEDAGITDLTIHDIRRTSGSIFLMKTGNMKAVQKFLGHKDMATTSRVYAHIDNDALRRALQDTFDGLKKD
jgi:integrase